MDRSIRRGAKPWGLIGLLLALAFIAPAALAEDEEAPKAAPQMFETAEAAANALIEATKKNDDAALKALVGSEAEGLVQNGEDPVVKRERESFAKAAAEKLSFEKVSEDQVTLVIGHNRWPLPIPLMRKDGKWFFDGAAGKEEILARRIGRNELEAIEIAKAYAAAQVQYASVDRDGDKVREYAQKILSDKGQKNGLFWPAPEGSDEEPSPFGPFVESIGLEARPEKKIPVNGYYWKILKGQGANAPGGAHSYIINGNMIAGFALVGVPAEYMKTGVMTFLVSHHGKVLEKDLGETSVETVKAMEAYDPDDTWNEVGEEVE